MQESKQDFSLWRVGCCLYCPTAEPGCLCYECNCSKCYWYSSPSQEFSDDELKGHCEKVAVLKAKKEEQWLKNFTKSVENKRKESLTLKQREQNQLNNLEEKE